MEESIFLPPTERFKTAKITNVDANGNYAWTEVEMSGRAYIGSLVPDFGTLTYNSAKERNGKIVAGGSGGTSGSTSSSATPGGGFPFYALLHLEAFDGLNDVWVFDYSGPSTSRTSGSGSASSQTNSFEQSRTLCEGGVRKRYVRTTTLSGGLFSSSAWVFSATDGCCTCPGSASGSGSGSGSGSASGSGSGTAGSGSGGPSTCCGVLPNILYVTLSGGHGSFAIVWDGLFWIGSKALSCGETLWVRMDPSCIMGYSCNGSTWLGPLGPVASCGPPFTNGTLSCDMDDISVGCVVGSCGTITADISQ